MQVSMHMMCITCTYASPQSAVLQADICQLGLDQRKVNVLAREYCDQCKPKRKLKPVILSHEMMPGLLQVRLPVSSVSAALLCCFCHHSLQHA